jgi:hypothetical protein
MMNETKHSLREAANKSLFALLLIAVSGPAQATPILWTLGGVAMADGATAFGSFVYDANTNFFSQIDVTTVGGSVFPGAHYVGQPPVSGLGLPDRLILVTSALPINFFGTPALGLYPAVGLTNAGGVVDLLGGIRSDSFETTCGGLSTDCEGPGPVRRYFTSGHLTGTATPEPAAAALTALGLLLIFCVRWARLRA